MAQPRPLEDQDLEFDSEEATPEIKFELYPRRVRAMFAGQTVVDSERTMLMIESRHTAVYYFPMEDVRQDLLVPSDKRTKSQAKGEARYWSVRVGRHVAKDAAWSYPNPPAEQAAIKDYVAFYWNAMDGWFEEDDEVYVHPRSPYHRVDVLNSSRHVKVIVEGEVVAETTRPRLLFETGLPTRYYIPKVDVRLDLLVPSDTVTACPYKGTAEYWSVKIGDRVYRDFVWGYPRPIPECPKIENLLCFFNERVDELWVDGQLLEKPKTPWSNRGAVRTSRVRPRASR